MSLHVPRQVHRPLVGRLAHTRPEPIHALRIADEHEAHDAPLFFAIFAGMRRVIVARAKLSQPGAAVLIDHLLSIGRHVLGAILRAEFQRNRAELHDAPDMLGMVQRIQHDHEAEIRIADEMDLVDAEMPADGFEIGDVRLQRNLRQVRDTRGSPAIAHVI